MNKYYITSDSHIRHKNIVRGISSWDSGYRDFNTQEEHDEAIIQSYNDVMDEGDTLIHLGDVVFGDKTVNVPWFLSRLRVKKFISVFGNHDRRDVIKSVMDPTASLMREFNYKGLEILLCHFPVDCWDDKKTPIHFFGHLHTTPRKINGWSMDVGLDGNSLKPYLLDDAIDFIRTQPKGKGRH